MTAQQVLDNLHQSGDIFEAILFSGSATISRLQSTGTVKKLVFVARNSLSFAKKVYEKLESYLNNNDVLLFDVHIATLLIVLTESNIDLGRCAAAKVLERDKYLKWSIVVASSFLINHPVELAV